MAIAVPAAWLARRHLPTRLGIAGQPVDSYAQQSGIRRPEKKALNPIAARPIEVFRNAQLTCHEAQALCLAFVLGAYWDELSKRFPFLAIMKPPSFAGRLVKSAKWAST